MNSKYEVIESDSETDFNSENNIGLLNNQLKNVNTSDKCSENLPVVSPHEDEEYYEEEQEQEENIDLNQSELFLPSSNESNGLDKLIQKQKIELAIELRRLQYGERPVTSNESKNRIQQFFENSISNQPAATSSTATFRSSAILDEISALGSQQRVSTILNTNRDILERSLQRLIAPNHRNNPVPEPVAAPRQSNPVPQTVRPFLQRRNENNTIEEITREQIISEISELVHTQLVTNALQNAEFRSSLERRVIDSLRRSGTDGNQPRQTIRELALNANSHISRNDFTHLGIFTAQQPDENLDSASSTTGPVARTTTVVHNSREIKELKSEILELKNMIKLSFEVTLDMQRSFRQEIAALMANTFGNSASASLINTTRPADEGNCVICTEDKIDSVIYSCGHMISCFKCSMNLKQKGHNCPVCRAPIKDVLRTYKSSME